jgi:nifR3 family TIM-barrel protein
VLFARVVAAAVQAAGTAPVTVKMRTGLDDRNRTALEAARIAEGEGVAAIALHARTAEQRYAGPARWDDIAELKQAVRSVPVLGNGDIWEASDALEMQRQTGCDGVVVGRGCLGRPWLFADLEAAYGGKCEPWQPNLGQVAGVMLRHLRLLTDHLGPDAAVRDFRKHVGWYLTGFPVGSSARRSLTAVTTQDSLEDELAALDPALTRPAETARWPRGHTDGPRPVALPEGWLGRRLDPEPPVGADLLVSGG